MNVTDSASSDAVRRLVSTLTDETVNTATPDASVIAAAGLMASFGSRDEVSFTVSFGTALPFASSTVKVSCVVEIPSAFTEVGFAKRVEVVALGPKTAICTVASALHSSAEWAVTT